MSSRLPVLLVAASLLIGSTSISKAQAITIENVTEAAGSTLEIVKKQQDVKMAGLMAEYVRLSAILIHMKFATSAGASLNGISNPELQMLAKSGVIAIDLTVTTWAALKTYANGKSMYTRPVQAGTPADRDAASFNQKSRVGRIVSRVQRLGGATAWTAIWGGGVVYYWRNVTPVLLLEKEDFDAVLKLTEGDIAVIEAQLSEQARVQLGLSPKATAPTSGAELFKID